MPHVTQKGLITAGEKFLLHLYGALDFPSLDASCYMHAVARKSNSDSFNLAVLPPTTCSGAAKQHIIRTYLQVQIVLGIGWVYCFVAGTGLKSLYPVPDVSGTGLYLYKYEL